MLEGRWLTPAAHGGGTRPFLLKPPTVWRAPALEADTQPGPALWVLATFMERLSLSAAHMGGRRRQSWSTRRSLELRSGLTRAVALPACPLLPMKQKRPRPGSRHREQC